MLPLALPCCERLQMKKALQFRFVANGFSLITEKSCHYNFLKIYCSTRLNSYLLILEGGAFNEFNIERELENAHVYFFNMCLFIVYILSIVSAINE